MTIDRRKLNKEYYLVVENITFASDAIGAASGTGRSATTAWLADAEVVFKGLLKEVLVFAVMAFDVSGSAISETFSLIPAADYQDVDNLTDSDIVDVISLSPTDGENIVLANDITFMTNLTNGFRGSWTDVHNVVVQEKATPANKTLYLAELLELLCYAYQYDAVGDEPVYTLYDFALLAQSAVYNKGADYVDIDGASGPTELEAAHKSLANLVLAA